MPSTGTLFPSSTSPPVLPVPRQPSPLSFTMLSEDRQPSPPTPASSFLGTGESVSSRSSYPASASSPNLTPTFPNEPLMFSPSVISSSDSPSSSAGPSSRLQSLLLPVEPSPDSLLLRSTFSALEHSTSTLKRLSKSVLNTASVVAALAEQLERAEDDLFNALGDLGRWLENGYGIQSDESVWDGDSGIKKISKQRRRKEREDREIWVENGLKAIKGELKRQGLAGGGAQSKFENTAKQFYHQTSVYLSPQNATASTMSGPSSQTYVPSGTTTASCPASAASHNPSAPSDMAQAFRHAQWDLARYNHHSTLLYAVPPSSIDCLDLLVGLYGWVGGLLDETPGRKDVDEESISGIRRRASTAPINHKVAAIESSQRSSSIYNCEYLKTTLTTSLSHLSRTRNELLKTWAERDRQTQMLEEQIVQRQIDLGINSTAESTWSRLSDGVSSNALTPVSSAGIEHKKGKKMHKIHRSVGGRLMDFLTPSGSSNNLASLSVGSAERLSRVSLDGNFANGATSRPAPVRRRTEGSTTPTSQAVEKLPTHPELPIPSSSSQSNSSAGTTPPLPPKDAGAVRPRLSSRHSVQMPTGNNYVSPFIASDAYSVPPIPYEDSPDLKSLSDKVSSKSRQSLDGGRPSFGGVGGLGAGVTKMSEEKKLGARRRGVLWGLGSWEGLNKATGGKGKWEKFWVVLDHSRIYEYRDNKTGVPESAHAVIDLKFASVREGRGTERRFVFEIVTPAQGKRLYQATCETEMKLWLYAICNAIESCINGTSSVRTFDASKLRTVSGSLDDHALPARGKLGLGFNSRAIGLGFPVPPNGRRSMPPTPTDNYHSTPESVERRTRKTSLKKVLKQSGERLSNVVSGNSGYRNSFGGGLDLPRPSYLKAGSRTSLPLSTPEMNKFDINHMPPPPIPTSTRPKTNQVEEVATPQKGSWVDGEIEKKVLEMAGLGLGLGDSPVERLENGNGESPNTVKRRVKSEAVRKPTHPSRSGYMNHSEGGGGETMGRSKSNDGTPDEGGQFDMKELKRIADLDGNRKCADCGKGMRSSRWATISIRETPMVLFICIRCCGIHRSLGTHISKPRSVDLDLWTPEMISSAREWGNERGNALWEESWQGGRVSDERITDFIKAKYIEGRWLTNENKLKFKIINEPVAVVGRAI